jgi:hypothetical protein
MTNQPDFRKLLEASTPGPWSFEVAQYGAAITQSDQCIATAHNSSPGTVKLEPRSFPFADNAALIVAAVNALPAHLARIAELEGVLSLCADQFRVLGRLANGGQIHRIEEGGKRVRMSLSKAVSSECEISEARVRAALSGGKP